MASRAVLLVPLCATVLSRSRIGAAVQPQPCGAGDLAALRGSSAGLDAAVDDWQLADTATNASNGACCGWPRVTCGEAEEGTAAVVAIVRLALPNRMLRSSWPHLSPASRGSGCLISPASRQDTIHFCCHPVVQNPRCFCFTLRLLRRLIY